MDAAFLDKLQAMRSELGFSFVITSGFRCEDHNRAIKGGPAHPLGLAGDIACYAERAVAIDRAAWDFGFMGKGTAQKSGTPFQSRFIHLDSATPEQIPLRPRVWSY